MAKETMAKETKEPVFEVAYERLEKILAKMNSGELGLEESLSLYEEADKLIVNCTKKLDEAEKKIQVMIKNRAGKLETNEQGTPQIEDFEGTLS